MAVARTQVLSKEVSHRFMVRNSSVDGEFNTSVHARLVLEPSIFGISFSQTPRNVFYKLQLPHYLCTQRQHCEDWILAKQHGHDAVSCVSSSRFWITFCGLFLLCIVRGLQFVTLLAPLTGLYSRFVLWIDGIWGPYTDLCRQALYVVFYHWGKLTFPLRCMAGHPLQIRKSPYCCWTRSDETRMDLRQILHVPSCFRRSTSAFLSERVFLRVELSKSQN